MRRDLGAWAGRAEQYEGPSKHPALPSSPSNPFLTENSQVGERVGDASAVTFAEEEEAASIGSIYNLAR